MVCKNLLLNLIPKFFEMFENEEITSMKMIVTKEILLNHECMVTIILLISQTLELSVRFCMYLYPLGSAPSIFTLSPFRTGIFLSHLTTYKNIRFELFIKEIHVTNCSQAFA